MKLVMRTTSICCCVWFLLTLVVHASVQVEKNDKPVESSSYKYISNSQIKLGVDLSRGGSISYLSAASNDINIVNTHDNGRLIQQSYYAGPQGFEDCTWSNRAWSWNPVAVGDSHGHKSTVLSYATPSPTSFYIKTLPMQWACDDIPCNCTFEQYIRLHGQRADVMAVLNNYRTDKTSYPAQGQEMPAIYTISTLYKLVTYNGSDPWKNDDLVYPDAGFSGWWKPGTMIYIQNRQI